jgi:hypothetical protein
MAILVISKIILNPLTAQLHMAYDIPTRYHKV